MTKSKAPKLRFRKEPRETGLASVAHPDPDTDILLGRASVGTISAPHAFRLGGWRIWLRLADEKVAGGWRNAQLKGEHETEPAARAWLQKHWDKITVAHKLHPLED